MNLTSLSIKRPVTTCMFCIGIILLGAISLSRLPQELFPKITYPELTIITSYENAAPEEIESLLTIPIEEAVGTVSGLKGISSISKEGISVVKVQFDYSTNMDFASLNLREKLDLIKDRLPTEAEEPIVVKYNPFEAPIMVLSVTSERHPSAFKEIVKKQLKEELEKVTGVASVSISGGLEREISVELNQGKLIARNISANEVASSIEKANLNYPAGTIKEGSYELLIRTLGEYKTVSDIASTPIITNSEPPAKEHAEASRERAVALKDIAEIKDAFKERQSYSRYNGRENITLSIQKQAQAATTTTASSIRRALKVLKKRLPQDVKVEIVYDQSGYIHQSIDGVRDAALQGSILTFLVLLYFLRKAKDSLIVVVSIPISIMATFPFMYFMKLSVNMMSLGGLALGVGMLVDNGIVVIENIYRHRLLGKTPAEAAVLGADEVTGAILSSTLTTVAVFLPMVFVVGVAGQIFKELALTVSFSLMVSVVVALTIIPLLSTLKFGALSRLDIVTKESFYESFSSKYSLFLDKLLLDKRKTLKRAGAVFLLSLGLLIIMDKEFMPKLDQRQFIIKLTMPKGTRLDITNAQAQKLEKLLLNYSYVKSFTATVGSDKGASLQEALESLGQNEANVMVSLKGFTRTASAIERIKHDVKAIELGEAQLEYILQESAFKSAFRAQSPITVEVKGNSLNEIALVSKDIEKKLSQIKGIYNLKNSLAAASPETQVKISKDKASSYNLSAKDIADTAQIALKGKIVTKFKGEEGKEIDVRLRFREEDLSGMDGLKQITIRSSSGIQVPLANVAGIKEGRGPSSIERLNRERAILIEAGVLKRSLADVMRDVSEEIAPYSKSKDIKVALTGEKAQMAESFGSLIFVLILSVALVYMIMAAQFESYWQPFVIMATVPLSLIGVAGSLFLTFTPVSIVVILGIVILGGVVVNNGIVLIDFVNQLKKEGTPSIDAIREASQTRLRPILMTALTTVFGLIPMCIPFGEGSEMRVPLALTVMGGLLVATILTLGVIPCAYLLMEERIFRNKQ